MKIAGSVMKSGVLKLLRNKSSSSLISTVNTQLQNGYCSTINKKGRVLRVRFEQKQLFGPVISDKTESLPKKGDGKKATKYYPKNLEVGSKQEIKVAKASQASEFYWLVQRERMNNSNKFKIYVNNEPTNRTSYEGSESKTASPTIKTWNNDIETDANVNIASREEISQKTRMSTKGAIISAKNLLKEFVVRRTSGKQQMSLNIPFDDIALNSIVNYPLVCKKLCKIQGEELLADTSVRLPSISKVLQATMPESARIALRKWKLGKIEELGLDGFKEYEKQTLQRGKIFHSAIENFLSKGDVPSRDSSIVKLWDSIDNSLNSLKPKPVLLEQPILHADLKYKGIIDNVSIVKDELCAFEWKTSEKSKPRLTSTYDAPVQLCAYLGALNVDPRYEITVKNGCVVVAYTNGNAANVFNLTETDLRKYWLLWLQRLQEYWIRVRDGTLPDPI